MNSCIKNRFIYLDENLDEYFHNKNVALLIYKVLVQVFIHLSPKFSSKFSSMFSSTSLSYEVFKVFL